jgi:hypothetical protein
MPMIDVHAIFMPTRELDADTAYLFAGRKKICERAIKSLSRPQGCIAIFGERGVGKSSLGRIIAGVLGGRIAPKAVGIKTDMPLTRRACVRAVWSPATQSPEHLLYQLFNPALLGEETFAQHFPEITRLYHEKYEKVDLKKLAVERTRPSGGKGPNQVLVLDIFKTIEDACFAGAGRSNRRAQDGVVILIDEMEKAKKRGQIAGLGELIKLSRFQFISIGIGASVNDILDEDLSAERKFAGGQFLVEPLRKGEVRELFDKASKEASKQGAKLTFTDSFCELVFEDFAGYPLQIQAFGLDLVLYYQKRLEAGIPVKLDEKEYVPLLQLCETSVNRDFRAMNDLDAGIGGSTNRWEILKAIVVIRDEQSEQSDQSEESKRWIRSEQLRTTLDVKYQVNLQVYLKELVKFKVLESRKDLSASVCIASPAMLCEVKRRIREAWAPRARFSSESSTS